MISVIIPAYNEGNYLKRCVESVILSSQLCPCNVEIIPVLNVKHCANARNLGVRDSHESILVFVDADCVVSRNFLSEIYEKSLNPYFIGGGTKYVQLDKLSPGRIAFLLVIGVYLYFHQITVGAFWVRKEVFNKLNGFKEIDGEDIDFAFRLKKYAKNNKKKFESLKRSYIVWSTRAFDKHGDWHWLGKYKTYHSPKTTGGTILL